MFYDEYANTTNINELEIAFLSSALFEQYDETLTPKVEAANDDEYENLYPFIA